jgi:hypothetical protein
LLHVAQACLKFTILLPYFSSAGITSVYHHTRFTISFSHHPILSVNLFTTHMVVISFHLTSILLKLVFWLSLQSQLLLVTDTETWGLTMLSRLILKSWTQVILLSQQRDWTYWPVTPRQAWHIFIFQIFLLENYSVLSSSFLVFCSVSCELIPFYSFLSFQ